MAPLSAGPMKPSRTHQKINLPQYLWMIIFWLQVLICICFPVNSSEYDGCPNFIFGGGMEKDSVLMCLTVVILYYIMQLIIDTCLVCSTQRNLYFNMYTLSCKPSVSLKQKKQIIIEIFLGQYSNTIQRKVGPEGWRDDVRTSQEDHLYLHSYMVMKNKSILIIYNIRFFRKRNSNKENYIFKKKKKIHCF